MIKIVACFVKKCIFPITLAVVFCIVTYSAVITTHSITIPSMHTLFRDTIIIKHANTLTLLKENDSTTVTVLEGDVVLQQGNAIFKANKAVKNDRQNTFEAWGNVHINQADTTDIYADHLKYLGNTQLATLDGNVKMTDRQATLTTPSLQYNMSVKIATYNNGGKVVSNKKTVITSREGLYYTDIKDAYFKKNVVVNDPAYHITTDTLKFNTETRIATFVTLTHIKDSARRSIDTREGYYNLRTGQAEFGQRPFINDDNKSTINANRVYLDNNIARAEGNAIVVDSTRGTIIIANLIYQNRVNEAVLATQKPVMIIKQDNDSIYVAADTLFSAKLSDLFDTRDSHTLVDTTKTKDSITLKNTSSKKNTDSTNRYFEAFHNVKIFSDSLQAVSDSLFYSFKDSIFRLYKDPIVWGKESQITGDTILLHTRHKQPHWMEVFKNGFMVNHLEKEAYNQIKSTRMDAYFINGGLDSVRAKGSAETIYYIQDDDSAYTGVNQSTSDIVDIHFKEKQLTKVVMRSNVDGTIYPIRQKSPSEMRLEGFNWREALRPKTKYDLFE